jgi:hypothetical protein
MKKLIPLFVVGMVVLCGLEAIAVPFGMETTDVESWEQIPTPSPFRTDILDQQQPLMDFFGPVGQFYFATGNPYYVLAQSFTPTKPVLTRVELMIGKNSTTTYDYTVAIRDALNGVDLTSASVPAPQIVTMNFSWIEFNFPDIAVTPGNTYYIVSSTINATDNLYFWGAWGLNVTDVYPNGTIYYRINNSANWTEETHGDMTFMTYGRENIPPNEPLIEGKIKGKVGVEYSYNFSTDDLDGDDVYYWIDWGDGTPVVNWTGPYASGEVVIVKHTYVTKSTYTIRAKAKDTIGAESTWGYLEVTMPKNTAFVGGFFFQRLFDRFPFAFPLLRYLLG